VIFDGVQDAAQTLDPLRTKHSAAKMVADTRVINFIVFEVRPDK
jgi:hypothetical protein